MSRRLAFVLLLAALTAANERPVEGNHLRRFSRESPHTDVAAGGSPAPLPIGTPLAASSPMDQKSTNAAINRLIEACYDGQHGYQTAAHHVTDMELKRTLGKFALERKHFAEELAKRIDRETGTPVHHGTFKGALHRGWMELKGKDHDAILKECLRGEEAGIACFEEALAMDLPVELKALLDEQIAHIVAARGQLERMAKAHA